MLLAQVRDQDVAQRVLAAQAEHEVGQVVEVVRRGAPVGRVNWPVYVSRP